MPPGFLPVRNDSARTELEPQVWLPLRWDPPTKYSRTTWGNRVYARLKPGVTLQQAQAEMDRVAAQIHVVHPEDSWSAMVIPLDGFLFGAHKHTSLSVARNYGIDSPGQELRHASTSPRLVANRRAGADPACTPALRSTSGVASARVAERPSGGRLPEHEHCHC
jgi:hypothetical protein